MKSEMDVLAKSQDPSSFPCLQETDSTVEHHHKTEQERLLLPKTLRLQEYIKSKRYNIVKNSLLFQYINTIFLKINRQKGWWKRAFL